MVVIVGFTCFSLLPKEDGFVSLDELKWLWSEILWKWLEEVNHEVCSMLIGSCLEPIDPC